MLKFVVSSSLLSNVFLKLLTISTPNPNLSPSCYSKINKKYQNIILYIKKFK